MASAFTHAFFAITMGRTFIPNTMPPRFWTLSVLCSILPDIDAFGFFLGLHSGDILAHRGFTHSIFFAFLLSLGIMYGGFRDYPHLSPSRWKLWLYFFLLTCSHGFLDALTNGGWGIAFFSPLDTKRYFLPWRPISVSPLGLRGFLTPWGREVIISEFTWVWIPSLLFLGIYRIAWRRFPQNRVARTREMKS